MSISKKLIEWHAHNLITTSTFHAIKHYEAEKNSTSPLAHYGLTALAILCIALGLWFIIAANWQSIPFSVKLITHILINFGLAGWLIYRTSIHRHSNWDEVPLLVLAACQLSLMALIGQYLHNSAPIDDVILYWGLLIGPMLILLGRTALSALLLIGLSFYITITHYHLDLEKHYGALIITTVAFFILSTVKRLQTIRPQWATVLYGAGFYGLIVLNFCILIVPDLFTPSSDYLQHNTPYGVAAFVLLALIRLVKTRFTHQDTIKADTDILMWTAFTSLAVQFLGSGEVKEVLRNMLLFCTYFLGLAVLGYRHHKPNWIIAAVVFVAGRLIIYFAQATENMLINGVCMMAIGLIALLALRKVLWVRSKGVSHA
jgi:uncharacterized membrane protein